MARSNRVGGKIPGFFFGWIFAFETALHGENDDDWEFNGLLAVLEVLADIHKVDFSGQQVYERQLAEIHATR